MMCKYLSEIYNGDEISMEYLPYLMEYSEIGNLKCLSALWNYFIDSHEMSGLLYIDIKIIPEEKDQKAIAEYYWSAAVQFQHDGLFKEAITYNFFLINHSKVNNFKEYLFSEIDGIKHSIFEFIANCFDNLGDNQNYISSMLNALYEVNDEFGSGSEEYRYYLNYLSLLMDDPIKGPILKKTLNMADL